MKTLKFIPKSFIRVVNKEVLVLSGELTIDVIDDADELPANLWLLHSYLEDYGTWEEVNNG